MMTHDSGDDDDYESYDESDGAKVGVKDLPSFTTPS